MSWTIRPAVPAELTVVGALTRDAYVADGLIDPADVYVRFLMDAAGRARDALVLVAVDEGRGEVGGEVVGTVTYVEAGGPLAEIAREGEAEMRSLAVSPAGRGGGVGEALVRHCLALARARGRSAFVLSSTTQMRAAHRLYERLGFTRAPERDWVPVPGRQLWAFHRSLAD